MKDSMDVAMDEFPKLWENGESLTEMIRAESAAPNTMYVCTIEQALESVNQKR